jgi:hypothetical protein
MLAGGAVGRSAATVSRNPPKQRHQPGEVVGHRGDESLLIVGEVIGHEGRAARLDEPELLAVEARLGCSCGAIADLDAGERGRVGGEPRRPRQGRFAVHRRGDTRRAVW